MQVLSLLDDSGPSADTCSTPQTTFLEKTLLTTPSLSKVAIHKAIFPPTLHHWNTDDTARDVTANCTHAHLGNAVYAWAHYYETKSTIPIRHL